MTATARRVVVSGRVQGVGFRVFAHRAAAEAGVRGWVRNLPDGSVETVVEGEPEAVDRYLQRLRRGPLIGKVTRVAEEEAALQGFLNFEITG
jgi:acylphosphatase